MEEPQTQQSPNLSLADITLALQIIQVASQRGAFKTEEFAEVGGCYNRILGFLEASGAVQRTPDQPPSIEPPAAEKVAAAPEVKTQAAKKPAAKKAAPKSKGKTE